jgi:hypothetical protein
MTLVAMRTEATNETLGRREIELLRIIATGAVITIALLSLTGFCFVEGRYLSNRELFEKAIAHQSHKIGDYLPTDTPVSYLEKHADCCSIPTFQPANSVLNIILGYRIRYVRVVYRRLQAEIDRSPRAGEFYEAFVEVTPCGRTIHAIGTSLSTMDWERR